MKWPSSGYNLLIGELAARQQERGSGWAARRRMSPRHVMLRMGPTGPVGGTCLCLPPEDTEPWLLCVLGYADTPVTQGCPSQHRGRAPEPYLWAVSTLPGIISVTNWCCTHARVGHGEWMHVSERSQRALHLPRHGTPCTLSLCFGGSAPAQTHPGDPAQWVPLPGGEHRPVSSGSLARAKQLGSACLPS